MAGYEFFAELPENLRDDVLDWGLFLRRSGAMGDLEIETRLQRRHVRVVIDGNLADMQRFEADIRHFAVIFIRTRRRPIAFARFLEVFLNSNREALHELTDAVEKIAKAYGGILGPGASIGKILRSARSRGPGDREKSAVKTIFRARERWLSGDITAKDALVLADEGFENWLKARLGVGRVRHPELLSKARQAGLLTGAESARLARYHRTRNSAQHEGKRVRNQTTRTFTAFLIHLLNSR